MEFLDEDTRPRFLFQSRQQPSSLQRNETSQKPSKALLFVSFPISSVLLSLSLFYFQTEPVKSLLFWVSLSLLLGPLAPISVTGGDIRVGQGRVIPDPLDQDPQSEPEARKIPSNRRSKADRKDDLRGNRSSNVESSNGSFSSEGKRDNVSGFLSLERKGEIARKIEDAAKGNNGLFLDEEEKEWREEDVEMLKKQMLKNPPGKPGRWEAISGAFNGRHRVESVIKKAKELGERKLDDTDSYAQFLKNRKPLATRVQGQNEEVEDSDEIKKDNGGGNIGTGWSAGEDIALLNALKVFPKDAPMRWEKIAAAVPGKSKAACMKRVAELKKEFRSSKASTEK
ncbi:hypothetical protein SLEP1_g9027 [Rubroshorea leprosula]|uniref:Myb-like domain-containing protein n=1 Tax=Rubroshorea leprosula TaxID=152421 RepID=A0AAV5ICT1_9ROSI|nr:hypothetical protein SLEP1_g9027 [Rubroshorea leprosula]